jgi:hypothetical protein
MVDLVPSRPDSLDDLLGADHERLNAVLSDLEAAVTTRSPTATTSLLLLTESLLYHMTWEEKSLFPAVRDRVTASQRRSIDSLEIDHERLRDTLRSLESALAERDFQTALRLLQWLGLLLKGHNFDEEHGVYVEADRVLEVADRQRLARLFTAGLPRRLP